MPLFVSILLLGILSVSPFFMHKQIIHGLPAAPAALVVSLPPLSATEHLVIPSDKSWSVGGDAYIKIDRPVTLAEVPQDGWCTDSLDKSNYKEHVFDCYWYDTERKIYISVKALYEIPTALVDEHFFWKLDQTTLTLRAHTVTSSRQKSLEFWFTVICWTMIVIIFASILSTTDDD